MDFHLLNLGCFDSLEQFSLGALRQDVELHALFRLHCRERIQLKKGKREEIVWGGVIVPLEISHVKTGQNPTSERLSHTGGVDVDDAQVGCWNVIRREIAVGGCRVEHETPARGGLVVYRKVYVSLPQMVYIPTYIEQKRHDLFAR